MNFEDDLDRAIFALDLEVPPPGLRESILRATIYAPSAAMRFGEICGIGAALAFACWLAIALLNNKALAAAAGAGIVSALNWVVAPASLEWIAVGLAAVFWFSLLDGMTFRLRTPGRS